jgi:hypothetical protein
MAGVQPRNSCRHKFKRYFLQCEYIFSLMSFSVTNQEHFETNSAVQSANTRNKYHLMDQLSSSRHVFRKAFINILNNLPCSLLSLIDEKTEFKIPLKDCLNYSSCTDTPCSFAYYRFGLHQLHTFTVRCARHPYIGQYLQWVHFMLCLIY